MAAAASKLQNGTQRMLPAPLGKGQRWLVVHLRPRHDPLTATTRRYESYEV